MSAAEQPGFELTMKEAMKTGRFWMLMIAYLFIACFAAATNTHSTPFITDLGYSAAKVSAVISLFMAFLTIGKIVFGHSIR